MDKKDVKKIETVEKVEKAAKALDRGVEMADEKLSQVPSMMGEHKPKIMIALVILGLVALLRDPNLALFGALIAAVLYSSKIISALKLQMLKKAAKKELEAVVEPKKEVEVTVLEVKKED